MERSSSPASSKAAKGEGSLKDYAKLIERKIPISFFFQRLLFLPGRERRAVNKRKSIPILSTLSYLAKWSRSVLSQLQSSGEQFSLVLLRTLPMSSPYILISYHWLSNRLFRFIYSSLSPKNVVQVELESRRVQRKFEVNHLSSHHGALQLNVFELPKWVVEPFLDPFTCPPTHSRQQKLLC